MSRLRDERGQSTVELAGIIVLVLVAALFALQGALAAWSAVSATNAARTAARMASRGGDGENAGKASFSGGWLRQHADIHVNSVSIGTGGAAVATAVAPIYIVIPGLTLPAISETARIPYTG